jgi:hypothetical protein
MSLARVPHPVVGAVSLLPDPHAAISELREVYFFLASFLLFRMFLVTSSQQAGRFLSAAGYALIAVSLVALSHWFYDNGKLFWTFAPDNVFVSDRARWPFVNSNHLGHFMLPLFFIALGSLFAAMRKVDLHALKRKRDITDVVSSRTFQRSALSLTWWSFLLVLSLLTITASLSRGTWFGLAVSLIAFVLMDWKPRAPSAAAAAAPAEEPPPAMEERDRRRRHRRRHSSSKPPDDRSFDVDKAAAVLGRAWRPLILVLACAAFYFYLEGRGSELLGARVEFGLLHSKDDIRWQLYSDTAPMISEHLWFGVGLGGWAATYNRYMNPLLAGVNPVYLHSDPQQVLAEAGLVGVVPLALLFVVTFARAVRAARRAAPPTRSILCGLSCGLFGLLIASIFDFPFRIPAITFWVAALLALTTFYIDRILYSDVEKSRS